MRYFVPLYICLFVGAAIAQADVAGVVRNAEREPVQGASVVMLSLPDSTFVAGAATDTDGSFKIISEDTHSSNILKVQAFGYEPYTLNLSEKSSQPLDITLAMATNQLKEVVVSGKAPITTQEAGKLIFIPNDLANDVANARNLMKFVPLVKWTDRQVSIEGLGTSKIYLNGKDPHWDTIEVSSMLQTLDPHSIKRVEIITAPGATQSASLGGGIVNIIYDDPSQGWRGTVIVNPKVHNDNPSVWPNLWLNYQKNRFKTSINLEYYYGHNYNHETTTFDYFQSDRKVVNDTKSSSFGNVLKGKINFSYDLTKNSVVGVAFVAGTQRSHSKNTVNTTTIIGEDEALSKLVQTQDVRPDRMPLQALAYYTLTLDNKGSMLDVLASYGTTSTKTDYKNHFSAGESVQNLMNENYSFGAKADFTKVFNMQNIFMAGVAYEDSHFKDTQVLEDVYDKFKYTDRILQGYVQYNRRWSNYVSTNIGLRVESTHTHGFQLQDNQSFSRNYTDFFPSFAVNWNIPQGNQGLSLSYSRRIYRPSSAQLNPYKTWSSDNTYSQGNPNLKPEFSDGVYFTYSFLNKFRFSTNYAYSSQLTSGYMINTPDGFTVASYTNTGRSHYLSFGLDFSKTFFKLWSFNAYVSTSYFNLKTQAQDQRIASHSWHCTLHQGNNFIISRKNFLSAFLGQTVHSPYNRGTYKENWKYAIMAGVEKSFNFGLDASLSIDVPITGYKNARDFTLPDYAFSVYNNNHQYSLYLRLSYTFGKSRVSGAKDRTHEIQQR